MSGTEIVGEEIVRGAVKSEWIDANEHMNVDYYILAFDLAVDSLWEKFGITKDYVNVSNSSTFAVESHTIWQRELRVDDPYIITTQLLAYDEKRIHQFMRMYHAEHGFLAATTEWLNLHVDLSVRKVSPWPDVIRDKISAFAAWQGEWDWPPEAGKQMKISTPIYTGSTRQ